MTASSERRVLIVDDHRSFAEALAIAIDAQVGLRCVAIAATAAEGLDAVVRSCPDIVLVDMRLPDQPGLALAKELQRLRPGLPVLALTAYADAASVSAAAQAGVCAFLRKECSVQDILATLRTAGGGTMVIDALTLNTVMQPRSQPAPAPVGASGIKLTPREHEVLELLAQAHDARGIAKRLGISIHTIRGYVKSLLSKFDVHTQLELVVRARDEGVISTTSPARAVDEVVPPRWLDVARVVHSAA